MRSKLEGTWQDQVQIMRGITAATGVLHEAQVLNLKMWGGLAFEYAGKWRCQIDAVRRVITYDIAKKKHPRGLPATIAGLDSNIRWLLGDEWSLTVTEDGKPLYVGSPQVTPVDKINEQRQARIQGRGNGTRRR